MLATIRDDTWRRAQDAAHNSNSQWRGTSDTHGDNM